jgi:Secretion system C-terminal sorting domain
MCKFLFSFLIASACWGQKIHHQAIASQGINTKITNGMKVSQSVGQVNAAVGNYKNSKLFIGQGYIQSYGIAKNNLTIQEVITMLIYPNPVMDIVNFKFSSEIGTIVTLDLFDNRGRLIIHQQVEPNDNSFTYDLSELAQGVYFAKIETTNQTFSTKILKSK